MCKHKSQRGLHEKVEKLVSNWPKKWTKGTREKDNESRSEKWKREIGKWCVLKKMMFALKFKWGKVSIRIVNMRLNSWNANSCASETPMSYLAKNISAQVERFLIWCCKDGKVNKIEKKQNSKNKVKNGQNRPNRQNGWNG